MDVQPPAAPNGRVVAIDAGYDLTLVAEVAPPEVDGVQLMATSVAFQDSVAVVSYNVAGEIQKGAVDVFVFDADHHPKLTSRATFSDTDVNAAGAALGRVYLATATADESLGTPAVVEALGLDPDGTLTMKGHFRSGLSSYAATGIGFGKGSVYVTSGNTGGVFSIDPASGDVLAQVGLDDARWVDAPGDGTVVAVRGVPGEVMVYGADDLSLRGEYPFEGAMVPESKSTVQVVGGKAFVAGGPGGTFVIDTATGRQLAEIPIPLLPGQTDAETVTNAVSVDGDLVFISNGSGGVFLVAASEDLSLPVDEKAPPVFQLIGRLGFEGESAGSVNHITYQGGFLFVASGRGGLKIVRVEAHCVPQPEFPGNGKDDDCDGQTDEIDDAIGCSDGTREGFDDLEQWPDIASCGGGWSIPGILSTTHEPACARMAGDDGKLADGKGCNVADLCSQGWHVCEGAADVAESSPTGCKGADQAGKQFFAVRQSGPGCGLCANGLSDLAGCNDPGSCQQGCFQTDALANDIFGCGTLGTAPYGDCGPLDSFSHDNCGSLPAPWSCSGSVAEAMTVVKNGPEYGGVVCCRDR
ncbi:MAG: PQQ-binding-like beta-propeller repeat protein [Myxococcota bacterium]